MTYVAMTVSLIILCGLLYGQGYLLKKWTLRGSAKRFFTWGGLFAFEFFWIFYGFTVCKGVFTPVDALWDASYNDRRIEAKLLLLRGANPNERHHNVGSSLKAAVTKNHVEMVALILSYGGNADAPAGVWGDDSLAGYASFSNYPRMLTLLLDHGANTERGSSGNKPLVMAANRGNVECVKILLEHHADTEVRNEMGYTPLAACIAFKHPNHESIEALLIAAGAKSPERHTGTGK